MTPQEISDLYVDVCPREWRFRDGNCSDDDDLPLHRLEISAEPGNNNAQSELNNQIDGVRH